MKILCIVTARAGSKRFPGKNLELVVPDQSLTKRTWDTLQRFRYDAVRLGHEVTLCLSTDSETIANEWPVADRPTNLRPAIISQDNTSSMDVVRYEMRRNTCDLVVLLQPTSPLLTHEDVMAVFKGALKSGGLSMAVTKLRQPLSWMKMMEPSGQLWPTVSSGEGAVYAACGLYAARSEVLDTMLSFSVGGMTHGVEIPPERAVDIDYPVDLAMARWYLEQERAQLDMLHLC